MSYVTQKSSTAGWPVEQGQIRFSSFVGDCQKTVHDFLITKTVDLYCSWSENVHTSVGGN